MQKSIEALLQLGKLPNETSDPEVILEYESVIRTIEAPLTHEEALSLLDVLGSDDCFGLAWTLIHLIETSPEWPDFKALERRHGIWIEHLMQTAKNNQKP